MGIIYKNGIVYGNQPSTDAVAIIEPSEEASATSAHAYAVGEHFIYNDTLYRATAAIAIGDTITPDTNCVATNVMTEVEFGGGGGGGTSDYTQLSNKPQIDGVTLTGNKSLSDIGAASQSDLEDLEDITGDGQLSGFTATDLTGAANELRNTLNQLDQNMAYVESGNTASRAYSGGEFISWKGTLYTANGSISSGQSFTTGTGGNLAAVLDSNNELCGGLNRLKNFFATIFNEFYVRTETPFTDENGKHIYHICVSGSLSQAGQATPTFETIAVDRIVVIIPIFNDGIASFSSLDVNSNGTGIETYASVDARINGSSGGFLAVRASKAISYKVHVYYTLV